MGTATAVAVANPTVSVSGFGLNAVIGTFAVTAGGQVSIDASAEPDLDLFLGDETVTATANTGTLTGQSMSTALGTVSVEALTDIAVTGQALTSALGTVSVATTSVAAVTGQAMTTALGASIVNASATVLPTGQTVNTALGTVTVDSEVKVEVTGQTMSLAQGNSGVYAWQVVDDAATNTWTIVDDSATNTWRDAA